MTSRETEASIISDVAFPFDLLGVSGEEQFYSLQVQVQVLTTHARKVMNELESWRAGRRKASPLTNQFGLEKGL